MNYAVKFSCGDVAFVNVLKCEKHEMCVQMEYGPIWVPYNRVLFFYELSHWKKTKQQGL